MHVRMHETLQSDQFEKIFGLLSPFCRIQSAGELQCEQDIAQDSQPGEEGGFLKHHEAVRAGSLNGPPISQNRTLIGPIQAGPVSDAYLVEGGDAAEIAAWTQMAMEAATYSTESLSGPLEGGDFQLESVGDAGCRIQTTITPQGNLVLVTVLYGVECPAS